MARGTRKPGGSSEAAARPKGAKRRLRRLERDIEMVRDLEARRARQLESARVVREALEGKLALLRAAFGPAGAARVATDGATGRPDEPAAGPPAYCMRERRSVVMVGPTPIVMRNGRPAISGTCPSCGAAVVTTARAAARLAAGEAPDLG